MLRLVHLAILPGMLLTACTAWVFAEPTTRLGNKVAVESKQMYSNRPIGYTVPVPYYGTPMAPQFIVPPVAQYRLAVAGPATPIPTMIETAVQVPPAQQTSEKIFILKEPQPEVSVNDELDTFHARLAKIRLEQHQLPDALALIAKIKSETFKVRTVVSLAEYVSRDKNFQSEADQLYRLALAGMDALDRGQPFRIDASVVKIGQPPFIPETQPVVPETQPVVPEPQPGGNGRPSLFGDATPIRRTEQTPDPPPDIKTGDPPPIKNGGGGIVLPDGAGTGKQPPPPPPDGNGDDGGIVRTPPGIQPDDADINSPPHRTPEVNGSNPLSPSDSLPNTTQQDPPFVKPPPTVILTDPPKVPETRPEGTSPVRPPEQPTRRIPTITVLEENPELPLRRTQTPIKLLDEN